MKISPQKIVVLTLIAIIVYSIPYILSHDTDNLSLFIMDYVNELFIFLLVAIILISIQGKHYKILFGSIIFLIIDIFFTVLRHEGLDFSTVLGLNVVIYIIIPLILLSIILISLGILNSVKSALRKNTINTLFHQTNKAIHFEYNYDAKMVRLEATQAFYDSYHLENKVYYISFTDFLTYVHEEDLDAVTIRKNKLYKDSSIESYYRLKLPGMDHHLWFFSKSIPSSQNKFISIESDFSAMHEMITLVQHKDKAIEHSKIDLNFIMDHSSDFIVKYDKKGRLDYVSESFLNFFNIEEDEVKGKTYQELDDMFEIAEDTWFNDALQEETTTDLVKSQFKGESYWISWHNHTVTNEQGEFEFLISIGTNLTEMMKMNERLDYDSKHDQLTKLLNRRGLYSYISSMQSQAYTLFFIDIHHFMNVNDYYGSEVGDKMIVQVAKTLQRIDQNLLVSRYEGDEFILIATDKVSNKKVLSRLDTIKQKTYMYNSIRIPIHLHIGYAHKNSNESLADMITNASLAMAQSRQLSSLQIVEFQPAMRLQLKEKLTIIEKLKQAITDDQLDIYFQAIFDENKNKTMVESLARWYDKDIGYVSPNAFFQVAKEASLIFDLDYYLITKSIRTFAQILQDTNYKNLTCSINFTMETLLQEGIIKRIADFTKKHGVNPNQICIEITESTFVNNVQFLLRQIKTLKQYGFSVAIDDFGKEYSSLSLIKSLNVDIIKIDKQFTKDLNDENNQAIVKMVLEIATIQDAKVIVEGIELASQYEQLKDLGCHFFQGFHLEEPHDYLKDMNKEKR